MNSEIDAIKSHLKLLLRAPDSQLDKSMVDELNTILRTLWDAAGLYFGVTSVLDKCVYGSLCSDFVVLMLREEKEKLWQIMQREDRKRAAEEGELRVKVKTMKGGWRDESENDDYLDKARLQTEGPDIEKEFEKGLKLAEAKEKQYQEEFKDLERRTKDILEHFEKSDQTNKKAWKVVRSDDGLGEEADNKGWARMTSMSKRPSWDEYFLGFAKQAATRASCDRKHVGAVIVKDRRILSTGYNGAAPGTPSCLEVGHLLKDMGGRDSCIRSNHSELNAVVHAARHGVSIEGATIYITVQPCYDCAKMLIAAGIIRIVYGEAYESRYGMSGDGVAVMLTQAGVELSCLGEPKGPHNYDPAVMQERDLKEGEAK